MVTMEEVAKAAHVSRATVSRVLSNHPSIKMETRSNVMYWVKKLGLPYTLFGLQTVKKEKATVILGQALRSLKPGTKMTDSIPVMRSGKRPSQP